MLCKSNLLILVTMVDSWYNDDGYCSMGPRGRFYPYLYQVIDIGTGLYLGRAPRTKETLPDFL